MSICRASGTAGSEGDSVRSEHDRKEEVEKGRRKKADGPDSKNKNVGDALRAVYREAVSEEVPDEMIDLLNKLG
ncbi:hypothetical protein J7S20_01380 [Sphingomonadaceae bacterium LXI357]|uniref:Anti-sigma factor NepR domain-containing protein n=1 Tax=Stakelama marina TaxID=2826939 RepID=A0A8T4IAJ5_9SPHN|nr:hypothetical protein [Stakelama marina]